MKKTKIFVGCLVLMGMVFFSLSLAYAEEAGDDITLKVSPSVSYAEIDGDKEKFEEDYWAPRELTGGVNEFRFFKHLNATDTLEIDGSGIYDKNDYSLGLEFGREGVGSLTFEFEEFRKYYDGTGGYSSLNTTYSGSELDTDLHMDIGSLKVEGILEKEGAPRYIFEYEREYKDGAKSLTSWSSVESGALDPKIYPTFLELDEIVDIFKVGLEHTVGGVEISAEQTFEHTQIETQKINNLTFNAGVLSDIRRKYEDMDFDKYTTTLRLAKEVNDKLFTSFGMMFSHHTGGTIESIDDTSTSSYNENHPPNPATVEQDSVVLLQNVSYLPWEDLSIEAGVKEEFVAKKSSSEYNRMNVGAVRDNVITQWMNIKTSTDEQKYAENINLKYTRLKDMVFFAEADCQQQFIGLAETETRVDAPASSWETDTDISFYDNDFTLGSKWYPRADLNVTAQYKNKNAVRDYDHKLSADAGYSAFIDSIDVTSHIPSLKVGYKPLSWVACNLGYAYDTTEYVTRTLASNSSEVAKYRAHIYSTDVTFTPYDYLYLTLFYQKKFAATQTQARTGDNGNTTILPTYNADVDVFRLTSSYAPTEKTTVTGGYSMYQTDNFNDYSTVGLPLGVKNLSQDISIGLKHELTKDRSVELKYAFVRYDEDSSKGIDDYEAHVIYATMNMEF